MIRKYRIEYIRKDEVKNGTAKVRVLTTEAINVEHVKEMHASEDILPGTIILKIRAHKKSNPPVKRTHKLTGRELGLLQEQVAPPTPTPDTEYPPLTEETDEYAGFNWVPDGEKPEAPQEYFDSNGNEITEESGLEGLCLCDTCVSARENVAMEPITDSPVVSIPASISTSSTSSASLGTVTISSSSTTVPLGIAASPTPESAWSESKQAVEERFENLADLFLALVVMVLIIIIAIYVVR